MHKNTVRSNALIGRFVSPDTTVSSEETNEILAHLIEAHLAKLSPGGWDAAGLSIADCIRGNSFSDMCLYDPDVLDLSAADQSHIRQCLALFSKRVDIDIGVDREAAAYTKFIKSETACKLTNECIRALEQGRFQFPPEVDGIIHAAQRKIQVVLDAISRKYNWRDASLTREYDWQDADFDLRAPTLTELKVRFGPGSSSQVPKRKACIAVKLEQAPACSANMWPYREEALSALPWGLHGLGTVVEVHDAILGFVDKNAKEKRSTCTEPQLNMLYQLGLGAVLEEALLGIGLDIHDQGPNQRAAWYGSLSGYSATLDLSSASDTIARLLVRLLLPEDWYDLLCVLRSESVTYKGKRIVLEKISSMGNGFTFPLETLIFWAISDACSERRPNPRKLRTLVYGDDIIIPAASFALACKTLQCLGFTPNVKKSFATGSFRESCGHDYVFGINVRPCFISDVLSTLDVMKLHNWYYAKGDSNACAYLDSLIDRPVAIRGPQGYGDGHLHTATWAGKPHGRDKGWSGFTFASWLSKPTMLDELAICRISDHPRLKRGEKLPPVYKWDRLRKSRGSTPICFAWGARREQLVMRIATYAVMLSHQFDTPPSESPSIRQHIHYRKKPAEQVGFLRRLGKPSTRTEYDAFVTPGSEWVAKTLIYVLEPPYTIM